MKRKPIRITRERLCSKDVTKDELVQEALFQLRQLGFAIDPEIKRIVRQHDLEKIRNKLIDHKANHLLPPMIRPRPRKKIDTRKYWWMKPGY